MNHSGNIEIRIDKRTELLNIIAIISQYRKILPVIFEKFGNKDYIEVIEKTFLHLQDHPIIQQFNELITTTPFHCDTPVYLFLQLKEDFTFDQLPNHPFHTKLKSNPQVLTFLKGLPKFAKDSKFNEFYENNQKRYQRFIENYKKLLDTTNLSLYLTDYFQMNNNTKFIINLTPSVSWYNYCYHNNDIIIANMVGYPYSKTEEELYPQQINYEMLLILFHEFSHSFINPLTEKYNLIQSGDPIFSNIQKIMNKQHYGSNASIINEHIVRAVAIQYVLHLENNENRRNRLIHREKENGFIYIETILDTLNIYQSNRQSYKNMEDFYPVIIDQIKKQAKKYSKTKTNK